MNDLIKQNNKDNKIIIDDDGNEVIKSKKDGRYNKLDEVVDINGAITRRLQNATEMRKGKGKMTSEVLTLLKYSLVMGSTVKEACLFAGISQWNYFDWKKRYPKLFDNIESLKDMPVLKSRFTIWKNLENVETAKWYLERKKKDEFSIRTESVNTNLNINYDKLLNSIEKGDSEIVTDDVDGVVLDKMDDIFDAHIVNKEEKRKVQAKNLKNNLKIHKNKLAKTSKSDKVK